MLLFGLPVCFIAVYFFCKIHRKEMNYGHVMFEIIIFAVNVIFKWSQKWNNQQENYVLFLLWAIVIAPYFKSSSLNLKVIASLRPLHCHNLFSADFVWHRYSISGVFLKYLTYSSWLGPYGMFTSVTHKVLLEIFLFAFFAVWCTIWMLDFADAFKVAVCF